MKKVFLTVLAACAVLAGAVMSASAEQLWAGVSDPVQGKQRWEINQTPTSAPQYLTSTKAAIGPVEKDADLKIHAQSPYAMRQGPDGLMYVTSSDFKTFHQVRRYDPSTGALVDVFLPKVPVSGNSGRGDFAFTKDRFWLLDSAGKARKYFLDGTFDSDFDLPLFFQQGLLASNGKIYLTFFDDATIKVYDAATGTPE